MATQIRTEAPRSKDLYDEDFYVWAEAQAELLRAGRFEALDLANLTLEVEDLGGALRRSVRSNASVIIEHLLKLQLSPAQDPRASWRDSIIEHRDRLESELTPRLRQILEDELPQIYARTRRRTARKLHNHGEDAVADALPEVCPYSLDQTIDDWWP